MSSDLQGTWYNQHGSSLVLRNEGNGRLSGTFEPHVGFAEPGTSYPVTGFATGAVVGFVVAFPGHRTVTTWVGHATTLGAELRLETLWHMAAEFPPARKPDELWKGTWAGADTFTRERPAAEKAQSRPPHPMW
ncbi:MAG: hypothetical protein IT373_32730 [Polyangiaceae bacterium]|nr:hypothetical protein [Polyangiaceae bacterium]